MRQEVLIGVERRRRWSLEQKLQVLSEVGADGATVTDVARRYDISRQHIYQWRRQLRMKAMSADGPPRFLPVELSAEAAEPADAGSGLATQSGRIEIGLGNGRVVRAAADLSETLLVRLIRIVERA